MRKEILLVVEGRESGSLGDSRKWKSGRAKDMAVNELLFHYFDLPREQNPLLDF